jgi:hypothetical protein
VDTVAFAPGVRMVSNSLTEPLLRTLYSGVVFGLLAYVTGNQATHCLAVTGTVDEAVHNQIALGYVIQDYCRAGDQTRVVGTVASAFATARPGGGSS